MTQEQKTLVLSLIGEETAKWERMLASAQTDEFISLCEKRVRDLGSAYRYIQQTKVSP